MKRRLNKSDDPHGRVDVLLYRLAEQWMVNVEQQRGVVGLQEHLLPLLEQLIVRHVPQDNMIPLEIRELSKLAAKNRSKLC